VGREARRGAPARCNSGRRPRTSSSLRLCLVAYITADYLSHVIQAHLIQAKLRIYDMFGRSGVLAHAKHRCCLVACMCSDMG
jgi:hypothetical protein